MSEVAGKRETAFRFGSVLMDFDLPEKCWNGGGDFVIALHRIAATEHVSGFRLGFKTGGVNLGAGGKASEVSLRFSKGSNVFNNRLL